MTEEEYLSSSTDINHYDDSGSERERYTPEEEGDRGFTACMYTCSYLGL
jgi:hypothetical protein